MDVFSNAVVEELNKAFSCTAARQQMRREKMWGLFHSIRTSSSYIGLWVELFKQFAGKEPLQPSYQHMYQHVTDIILEELIRRKFPVVPAHNPPTCPDETSELGYEDGNATKYIAGYVCRALKKKVKS